MENSQLSGQSTKAIANSRGHRQRLASGAWLIWIRADWIKPLTIVLVSVLSAAGGESSSVDYVHDIRPILSNNCFKCHGPDEEARKADLRLDTPEGALADRGGHRAINRETPAES